MAKNYRVKRAMRETIPCHDLTRKLSLSFYKKNKSVYITKCPPPPLRTFFMKHMDLDLLQDVNSTGENIFPFPFKLSHETLSHRFPRPMLLLLIHRPTFPSFSLSPPLSLSPTYMHTNSLTRSHAVIFDDWD